MDKEQLQHIFQNPFQDSDWVEVLRNVFGAKQLLETPKRILLPDNQLATGAFELGNLTTSDDRIIGFYRIDLNEEVWLQRNKVGLRQLLRNVYKYDVDGAIVVFVQENKWRLSFISEIKVRNEQDEIVAQNTPSKRFTYLLGKGEQVHTPVERITKLKGNVLALKDIYEAFSVESLTKEFYDNLYKWFEWAKSDAVGITFPNNTATSDDDRVKIEEQLIRLITRMLFVWFIKQKSLIPEKLFKTEYLTQILRDFRPKSTEDGHFYNAILQNLGYSLQMR